MVTPGLCSRPWSGTSSWWILFFRRSDARYLDPSDDRWRHRGIVESRNHSLCKHAMVSYVRSITLCAAPHSVIRLCVNHIRPEHQMEPEVTKEQHFFLIGSLLLHLAFVMCPAAADLNGLLDHAIYMQRDMGGSGFPVQLVNAQNSNWSKFLANLKVPAPKQGFSKAPLNPVAALLHWRVLLVLGSFLPEGSQGVFWHWLAKALWEHGVSSRSAGALGQLGAVHGSHARAHLDKCQRELQKGLVDVC